VARRGRVPDYKALVCVFLYGGNDSSNTVLPTDPDSWARYWRTRDTGEDPIALMPVGTPPTAVGQLNPVTGRVADAVSPEAWGGVLPIAPRTAQPWVGAGPRGFALHPMLAPMRPLFEAGRLAVVANVGTLVQPMSKAQYLARSVRFPAALFSHNDQQSVWQAGAAEGVREGWGGRMGDRLASMNGANTLFTSISTAGNAVFLSGRDVIQYQLTTQDAPATMVNGASASALFGGTAGPARLREIIADTGAVSDFANDYGRVVGRSLASAAVVNQAFAQPLVAGVRRAPAYVNPLTGVVEANALALQLQTVARMVAAAPSLGLRRQVFFVSLGGFDTHNLQNRFQTNNLAKLAHALAYFDEALSDVGGLDKRSSVTTFTGSDFSRTLNSNGDGTDHAWGGHHFVLGGAVKGGDIYGRFPTLGVDAPGFDNPDGVGGALIPTTSVDQYAATLGAWFGASASDLHAILPNLRNFAQPTLGFM
jgi:uncharacterized protein (DUF1501 family)